ncbi:Smr/MutS family protein [Limibacter armeniacum]|uniref:endonuclease MutS2 n=1 Tax=Limibacter armeniacum TaxID=466084 RepID=UPI002FE508BC
MLYPRNLEEKIGFDKIREILKEKCSGEVGKQLVDKIRFSAKEDLIRKRVSQVDEFMKIMAGEDDFPVSNYIDVSRYLSKASLEGTFLLEEEMYDLKRAFTTLDECLNFFRGREKSEYPELIAISSTVEFDRQLLRELEAIIDDKGKVKSNASPELQRIRSRLNAEQASIRNKVESVLRNLKQRGFAKEDVNPTVREGRIVVPVAAEYKRQVKGFVHDASSSGQTVFIEPEELLNLNNEIKDLMLKERQEVVRILTKLTDKIRPEIPSLTRGNKYLGLMDFIRAKAKLAVELEAIKPDFVAEPKVEWYHVKHPLLVLSYKNTDRSVVAQNIKLDEEVGRIVLISGPNAGGKSVALKTVGLIQYMFQCGLLVPMVEGSKMGIFEDLFMDYGDEQSLENDLSTYSSHLTNMRHFLKKSSDKSLILIDEFGAGTEPELGGAIAEAILEQLNRQKAFGVITTHYANLKLYADKTEGLMNGAMRYDVENLQPLYKLEQGQPGSSFALEIAGKIGLPKKVVNIARHKAGRKKINMEQLLLDLESEKKTLREQNFQLKQKENQLKQLIDKYEHLKTRLETSKEKVMNKARIEAEKLLVTANKKIEHTIKEIRETQADKERAKKLRADIDSFKEKVKPEKLSEKTKEYEVIGGTITIGDKVKLKDQETFGEIMEINGKEARVMIGELESFIRLNRLVRISSKEYRKETRDRYSTTSAGANLHQKQVDFSPNLDLRGKRAEEVMFLLDDFMDTAIMLGQTSLRIVHGKGTGALREVVRNHLKTFGGIKNVSDEHPDRGGAGVTVITLR